MRPCWLMNPSSVAQVFPLREGLFDLAIFDEASQCPIEQALPVLYRGKDLLISGDEKQLPPTSFFSARYEEDPAASGDGAEEGTGEGEEEATSAAVVERKIARLGVERLMEVEDLLDAAVGTLPELYLCVHYRSEHPALVEYSNRAFYGGRLEAPPSCLGDVDLSRPIRYVEAGGLYSGRTNPEEAAKVIEVLKGLWLGKDPAPTAGVVTFNQPQRDLIEDAIQEECKRDEAFAAKYQEELGRKESNQDVGFFVKNLENVQGDERDVMVFSTTFGRDEAGRFYKRFGPVGAVGGERRLNVAVTRAKREVVVVGSMPVEEVADAISAGGEEGALTPAGYLQLYLAYARAVAKGDRAAMELVLDRLGKGQRPARPDESPESPFEEDVAKALAGMGYEARRRVGQSGFLVDVAVLEPAREGLASRGYVLGIDCDGPEFHLDRSARLRDVWRDDLLRRRGWNLHRIWSTRWWYHRDEETAILRKVLEKAISRGKQAKG